MSGLLKLFGAFAGGDGYVYSTEYQAVLDWAAVSPGTRGTPPPLKADRIIEDLFVRSLVSNGIWALADQLCLLNTFGSENWSLINIKTPGTRNLTKVVNGGSLAFTAGIGWVDPSKLGYLDCHYIPSVNGVNYTQNSCGVVLYASLNKALNAGVLLYGSGGAAALNALSMVVKSTNNTVVSYSNRATGETSAINSNSGTNGILQTIRTANNAYKVYRDDYELLSGTGITTGLSTVNNILLGFNSNGTIGNRTDQDLGFWMIGGAFNKEDVKTSLAILFTRDVAPVTFNDWTDVANDLSPYLAALSTFPAAMPSQITPSVIPQLKYSALSSTITGTLMYQGGVWYNDYIYFVSASKTTILKLNTLDDTFVEFGSVGAAVSKWSGGVLHSNGKIYFCAYTAKVFLELDPTDDSITYFDTTGYVANEAAGNLAGATKWNSIFEGSDGRLYAVPFGGSINTVCIIDVSGVTPVITFIDTTGVVANSTAGNLAGAEKWDSAVLRGDYIYGSPSTIATVLKINTLNGTCSTFGSLTVTTNRYGLGMLAYTGDIYIFPYAGPKILKIDQSDVLTDIGTFSALTGVGRIGGLMTLPDGKIASVPLGNRFVYIFDPLTETLTEYSTQTDGNNYYQAANLTVNVGLIVGKNGFGYSVPYSEVGGSAKILKVGYQFKTVEYDENYLKSRYVNKGY